MAWLLVVSIYPARYTPYRNIPRTGYTVRRVDIGMRKNEWGCLKVPHIWMVSAWCHCEVLNLLRGMSPHFYFIPTPVWRSDSSAEDRRPQTASVEKVADLLIYIQVIWKDAQTQQTLKCSRHSTPIIYGQRCETMLFRSSRVQQYRQWWQSQKSIVRGAYASAIVVCAEIVSWQNAT